MNIEKITSRQILDSRGRPTLETTVYVDTGVSGTAAVPAGASTGSHEAVELRDGGQKYGGFGVTKALKMISGPINKALVNQDIRDQEALDQRLIDLDGTVNKSKLGSNAILSVSLACARAAAALERQPLYFWLRRKYDYPDKPPTRLPRPMMNVINGGRHADTELKVQEFMVIPAGPSVAKQVERGLAVYRQLQEILNAKHLRTTVGDEGGFAPALTDPRIALDFLLKAVTAAGYSAPDDIGLGLDIAASELYNPKSKRYEIGETKGGLSTSGMISLITEWENNYPLLTVEDPLAEDDWDGWRELTKKFGTKLKLVGDDLFVTNLNRLERGISSQVANAILIKPNQIGTLSETMATIARAQSAGYTVIVSHRSGETNDDFIADLAVAVEAEFIKAGAPARGERVAKYNRLLAIAAELGQT